MSTPPNLPAKRSRHPRIGANITRKGELGGASLRLQAWELADINVKTVASDVRKILDHWRECMMGAMSVLNKDLPDWHARNAAAKNLADFYGVKAPKQSADDGGQRQVSVNINMPDWASSPSPKPVVIDVAQPREVSSE